MLRVLTWNLFHGRSRPEAGRELLGEFAHALAGWEWDVALLQEVPPWWPRPLARACGAGHVRALTSRNQFRAATWPLARRHPGLLKSWGGGANAILVRGPARAAGSLVLTWLPERRVAHAVALPGGPLVCNLHASQEASRARGEAEAALTWTRARAQGGAFVLGGDLNLRGPRLAGMAHAAQRDVDHVFAHGLVAAEPAVRLDAGPLSDHPPLAVALEAPG